MKHIQYRDLLAPAAFFFNAIGMSRDAWWRGDGAARPRGGWYERSEGDDGAASGSHEREGKL